MDTIKNALTRKFGPLPAWAWLGLVGIAIWWYERRYTSSSSGSTISTVSDPSQTPTDQSPTVLQAGETYVPAGEGSVITSPSDNGSGSNNGSSGSNSGSNNGSGNPPNYPSMPPFNINVSIPKFGKRNTKPPVQHRGPKTATPTTDKGDKRRRHPATIRHKTHTPHRSPYEPTPTVARHGHGELQPDQRHRVTNKATSRVVRNRPASPRAPEPHASTPPRPAARIAPRSAPRIHRGRK